MEFRKVSRNAKVANKYLERFYQDAPETDNPRKKHFMERSNPELETPAPEVYAPSFSSFIGNTPMVDLTTLLGPNIPEDFKLVAKMEFINPGLSSKDRMAFHILQNAVNEQEIQKGMSVITDIETEFDDAGASIAMVCAMLGLQCVFVANEGVITEDKLITITAYGAKVFVTDIEPRVYAERICQERPTTFFYYNKHDNTDSAIAYYETMGPEIWSQSDGMVTHFVSSGCSGATISGTGKFLKEASNGKVEVILAITDNSIDDSPEHMSAKLGRCCSRLKKSKVMNSGLISREMKVSDKETVSMCHTLAQTEGILAGIISGLNTQAAVKVAKELLSKPRNGPTVVCTVLSDPGIKFLKTVYNKEWSEQFGVEKPIRYKKAPVEHDDFEKKTADDPFTNVQAFSVEELIGETPLVDLSHHVNNVNNVEVKLFAKVEFFNPGYSIKDRIIQNIFTKAEKAGKLKPGMTVVAASSGNTGAATAMMCAIRGYKCVITTSMKCSQEKMDSIRAYGATLLVSPPGVKEGEKGHYMNMEDDLVAENPDWFGVNQYYNPDNPEGHMKTLGPEVWDQTDGKITHFVAAGSTGGTMCGTSKFLKSCNGNIKSILADPVGSIFTEYFRKGSYGKPGKFLVEGVGKGSIPGCMDIKIIDEVVPVKDCEAFKMCATLAKEEGILAGGSSGLNVFGAILYANRLTEPAVVVTVMPDSGIKYQSKVYNKAWLRENNLLTDLDSLMECKSYEC